MYITDASGCDSVKDACRVLDFWVLCNGSWRTVSGRERSSTKPNLPCVVRSPDYLSGMHVSFREPQLFYCFYHRYVIILFCLIS